MDIEALDTGKGKGKYDKGNGKGESGGKDDKGKLDCECARQVRRGKHRQ